jgi:hypothetical protein
VNKNNQGSKLIGCQITKSEEFAGLHDAECWSSGLEHDAVISSTLLSRLSLDQPPNFSQTMILAEKTYANIMNSLQHRHPVFCFDI